MKKIYLLILPLLFSLYANAQCTPDPNWNSFGISPGKLPDAVAGNGYATIISFVTPKDTSLDINGTPINVVIDSAFIEKISGYPEGFIYKCNNSRCTWKGGEKGCALLEGNAKTSHFSKYVVKVEVRTYFRIVGLSDPYQRLDTSSIDFKIVGGISSVININSNPTINVYPNPAKNTLQIETNNLTAINSQVVFYDLIGKVVLNKTINEEYNTLDISELPKGIYILNINNDGNLFTQKIIIE